MSSDWRAEKPLKLDIEDAIKLTSPAWKQVKVKTIWNCNRHTNIFPHDDNPVEGVQEEEEEKVHIAMDDPATSELGALLLEFAGVARPKASATQAEDSMTAADFPGLDADVDTGSGM